MEPKLLGSYKHDSSDWVVTASARALRDDARESALHSGAPAAVHGLGSRAVHVRRQARNLAEAQPGARRPQRTPADLSWTSADRTRTWNGPWYCSLKAEET